MTDARNRGMAPDELLDRLLLDPSGQRLPALGPGAPGPYGAAGGRQKLRRPAIVAAIACIMAGLFLAGTIVRFYSRSNSVGATLTRLEQRAAASAQSCDEPQTSGGLEVDGLIQAKSIGLTAPVVQGVGDPQLDVAVGHDPASAWPGPPGAMVLEAHDVTWFSQINGLHPGDVITYTGECRLFKYQVTGGKVVSAGSPVDSTAKPTLVLVTCYPLNALYFTSQRFIVDARLVSSTQTHTAPVAASLSLAPAVNAPAALAAQGLTLSANPVSLGTLAVTGSPASAWQESPRPLQAEANLLELYFGALRSAQQEQPAWWSQLAPNVPIADAQALAGASIAGNEGRVEPSLTATGDQVTGATLVADPILTGGTAPGAYRVTMTASVVNGDFVISGWQMQRLG
jgi:sortase A